MREFLKQECVAASMIMDCLGMYVTCHDTFSLAAFYVHEKIGINSNSKDHTVNGSARVLLSQYAMTPPKNALKSNIDQQYDALIIGAFYTLENDLKKMFEEKNAKTLINNEYSKLPALNISYSLPSLELAICGLAGAYLAISAPLKLLANSSLSSSATGLWEAFCILIGSTLVTVCIAGFAIISDQNNFSEMNAIINDKILEALDTSFAETELAKKLKDKAIKV